jgi:hypothetical protein
VAPAARVSSCSHQAHKAGKAYRRLIAGRVPSLRPDRGVQGASICVHTGYARKDDWQGTPSLALWNPYSGWGEIANLGLFRLNP